MASSSSSATSSNTVRDPSLPPMTLKSCIHSKWGHIALLVCALLFTTIAVLATSGLFCGIGVTPALHLSYGMYALAGFFLLAFIVKSVTSCCLESKEKKQLHRDIS